MEAETYFSRDYHEARRRILGATPKGARIDTYELPTPTADGQSVHLDVIRVHPDREKQVMLVSGTHGVEGLCGSGLQLRTLDQQVGKLPPDKGLIIVHALNPYGFAMLRRVNEDNVDLNRNFRDFTQPLPVNAGYNSLHSDLVPAQWTPSVVAQTRTKLIAFAQANRMAFLAAVAGGQYNHPDGLFFGGTKPTWSNQIIGTILEKTYAEGTPLLIALDLHTGLGEPGDLQCIYDGTSQSELDELNTWFGDVRSTAGGNAVQANVAGSIGHMVRGHVANSNAKYLALEFGTVPIPAVLEAMRAENWLYAKGGGAVPDPASTKAAMRDAFFVETPDWKRTVSKRFDGILAKALAI